MDQVERADALPVRGEIDVVLVRQTVRTWSVQQGFTLVDQTKMVTAASEIARNTVLYGRGGTVRIEALVDGVRKGLRLVFEDQGPGIPDVDLAMRDGYTTGTGLGMGLGGARRLVNEFRIESRPGQGTKVTLTRWK
ncbi:MAG: anti-sigma regulatory factor [Deltaproteobacteria bacterium]|nr:MAG: anti-sigma regulatory factor [Deltaproteobacteria bacterium]TMA77045.1 MAG: anti-sigma regulatory factor [Deltaproteobacteria bacterium]TMB42506.1 MAG: anti-sigma regulatory factor [Deltaproteobacteria bacterium]